MEQISKRFARTLESVRAPIQSFIDTGIFEEGIMGKDDWDCDISIVQVRRAARKVAAELKRPFIVVEDYSTYYNRSYGIDSEGRSVYNFERLDEPRWVNTHISIPKRKYLVDHVTPLILASENREVCFDRSTPGLWVFTIQDYPFWQNYQTFLLNDPDLRRARKLTS